MLNMETYKGLRRTPSDVGEQVTSAQQNTRGNPHAAHDAGLQGMSQALLEGLRNHPRLRMFLSEVRSFLHRSYTVLTNKDTHRVPMGFACLESPSGRSRQNTRAFACIQHIERISSSRPWATPLDWIAYRDSWEAGAEWALRTLRSDSSSDSEHEALPVSKRSV